MTSRRKSTIAGRPHLRPAALLAGWIACAPALAQLPDDPLGDAVENRVDSTVSQAIEEQVQEQVEAVTTERLQERLEEEVASQVESTVSQTIEGQVEAQVEETVTEPLREGLGERLTGTAAASGSSRTFAGALDEDGWPVERDTWVMLIAPEHLSRIQGWGFTVEQRRPLDGLGLVLVRLDAPDDRGLARVAARIAREAPGTVVDYNHVYRPDDAPRGGDCPERTAPDDFPPISTPRRNVAVGIIDTAVAADHPALAAADIVQKDFVPFRDARPRNHGTAVASILVGRSDTLTGRLPGARLYAASSFFRDPEGGIGATTESLVEALAWLDEAGVPVINMSLSGPPNRLLDKVIHRMATKGTVIVAAVGNNGPAGRPLYPAAYEAVVGITAVDVCHRIFRYANRGDHVTFSAPGVAVRVARDGGGYGVEQGTSMAAPYAAAVIAGALAEAPDEAGIVERLKTSALDLGERGFDDVFGFGLIAPLR